MIAVIIKLLSHTYQSDKWLQIAIAYISRFTHVATITHNTDRGSNVCYVCVCICLHSRPSHCQSSYISPSDNNVLPQHCDMKRERLANIISHKSLANVAQAPSLFRWDSVPNGMIDVVSTWDTHTHFSDFFFPSAKQLCIAGASNRLYTKENYHL